MLYMLSIFEQLYSPLEVAYNNIEQCKQKQDRREKKAEQRAQCDENDDDDDDSNSHNSLCEFTSLCRNVAFLFLIKVAVDFGIPLQYRLI